MMCLFIPFEVFGAITTTYHHTFIQCTYCCSCVLCNISRVSTYVELWYPLWTLVWSYIKGGSISENFSIWLKSYTKEMPNHSLEHYPPKEKMLRKVIWHPFFEIWAKATFRDTSKTQLELYKLFGPIVKIWNGRFLMMIWCTDWYLSLLLAQLNESNLFSVSVSCQIQLLQRVSRKSMDFLLTI